MALVAVRCPSCGGDIKLDDSKEFGFCLNCGTKVMVQDAVQKIKVSGTVKMDMSDTAANCLNLADQDFNGGNFVEAYNYYTKMLEYDRSSYRAVFRKGLCAGYLSNEANIRTNELVSGYKQASEMINALIQKGSSVDALQAEHKLETQELSDFALQFSSNFKNVEVHGKFNNKQEIDRYLQTAMNITNMLTEVNEVIDNQYEDLKKNILTTNVNICKSVYKNRSSLSYIDGYSIDKSGNKKTNYSSYHVDNSITNYLNNCRSRAANNFNNLPSNVESMGRFNSAIENQNSLIQKYKDSVSEYWSQNEEKYKEYKKIKTLSLVFMILGIAVSLVATYFLPPLGVSLIAAVIVLKVVLTNKKLDSFEDAAFTPELLQSKTEYKQNVKILKEKKKEKSQFESTLQR